jgi:molecular chaperone DnaK (HSP70)
MPAVREKLKEVFKKPAQASVSADEAVAIGAALYSGTVDKISSVVLIDVVPMTIGLGMPGGNFKRLIERNSPLPASKSFGIATQLDDQESLDLLVFQGEDSNATSNEFIGALKIEGLPRGAKGSLQLAVTLELDSECVLKLEARELKSNRLFKTTLATRFTRQELAQRLGTSTQQRVESEAKRADELGQRGGRFWGLLKKVFDPER